MAQLSGSWFIGIAGGTAAMAVVGVLLQVLIFRWMEGQELRQTLVTIGISIVAADLMLATWSGNTYQFDPPAWLIGTAQLPIVLAYKSDGSPVLLAYPTYRLFLLAAGVVVGIGLWLLINNT